MENLVYNNVLKIGGKVHSEPNFSHELYGEKFYIFELECSRLSGSTDILKVIVSDRLIDMSLLTKDALILIEGQFRSYNHQISENKSKLILTVFVKTIEVKENIEEVDGLNNLELIGYICKQPIYRKTPFGREIADVLLAVNRTYNKSDYIPCIMWGRNAKFCENLEVGTALRVVGRAQSRMYEKKDENGNAIPMVAYEVSVAKLELYKEDNYEIEDDNVSNEDEYGIDE